MSGVAIGGGVLGLALAASNGANDSFKGVATLFASRTSGYRRALAWALLTTGLGSFAALALARGLLAAFTGKGLVPAAVVADPTFSTAVALAAAATVLLATRLGLPVSTTHALVGALVGAGWIASPGGVALAPLGRSFVLPLALSPLLALALASVLQPPLHALRRRLRVDAETCICLGREVIATLPGQLRPEVALRAIEAPTLRAASAASCRVRYRGRVLGIRAGTLIEAVHYLSAGLVSFARGLNDTPKIAALLLAGGAWGGSGALIAAGVAMGTGGLLGARRVAWTLGRRVTEMSPGQGTLANVVTGLLVVGASHLGVPVSTTHVSSGSLFGVGAATRQVRWGVVAQIAVAWVATLPLAAALAALAFLGLGPIT